MEIIEIVFGTLSVGGAVISFLCARKTKKYSKICYEITLIEKVQEIILNDKELNIRDTINIEDVKQIITFSVDDKILQQALFELNRKNQIFCDIHIDGYKSINKDVKFYSSNIYDKNKTKELLEGIVEAKPFRAPIGYK